MVLKVIGSGSSGNCYILESDTEALIIEAGLPFMEVKKALDFNVKKIVGVIVSHCHLDHSKFVGEYEQAGIPIFWPYKNYFHIKLWGGFTIKPFELVHDVPCYGFLIQHGDMGKLLYASDTEYIKYRFRGLSHILVECNYDKRLIPDNIANRSHVMTGHMELQTTLEFLRVNDNPNLDNVVLLHISHDNGDPEEFAAAAEEVVWRPVWAAEKGLEVDLRPLPF